MKKWLFLPIVAVVSVACSSAPPADPATTTDPAATGNTPATSGLAKAANAVKEAVAGPTYREVTVPTGTVLQLELKSAVSSDTSHVEDSVKAALRQPVTIGGTTVMPAGTELVGTVTAAEDSGRVKGRARVAYRFNSVNVGGERYNVETAPLSHLAPATKGEDATKIAIGAGAGAALGALLGGGDGAAKGAAIGGASGTGVVLATKGKEVRLGPGADVSTKLTAPLMIRVRVS